LTALEVVPSIPRDRGEPVFREPWEARAFAMAVALEERKVFTWNEWAQALGAEITAAGPNDETPYYQHWLAALEKLVIEKKLIV
jgi:nitrile hydratase accessory protein